MLLDSQRLCTQERRNPLSRMAVPIEMVLRIAAVAEVPFDCRDDLPAVVVDIQHVDPPIPPELASADVDYRNAEERALSDPGTRVSHQAARVVEEAEEVLRRHVLEEVEVLR